MKYLLNTLLLILITGNVLANKVMRKPYSGNQRSILWITEKGIS